MRRRARHDEERNLATEAAAESEDLLRMDLEQRPLRDGTDLVHPLRLIEPEPRPLAPRDDEEGDLAALVRLETAFAQFVVMPLGRAGQGGDRLGRRHGRLLVPPLVKRSQLAEVEPLEMADE